MDLKSFAETYWSIQEKKLDPVGKEDGDVDNDGDKDSSDSYLMKRRAAIKKAMKKEEVEKEDPSVKAKMKRQAMIKKQVLMKKLQAVRAGAGADITSSHEPEGSMVEAKIDTGKSDAAKQNERNQRTFGNRRNSKGGMTHTDDTEARRYNTEKGRGVKMKGKKDKTPGIHYGPWK